MQLEYKVNWLKAQSDSTYKDRQMDIEEKELKQSWLSFMMEIHIMTK